MDALRQDFGREVESFISSILLENHSVVDLLTSKSTFLNQRLAQHYGIPGVTGAQFRKIELTDEKRFGLLGKAAVLMRTSYPNRTSPVLRGAWVLGRLQGTPPTPPPPTVENQDLAQKAGETPNDGATASGDASRQSGVPTMPWRDRSSGIGARELRCHWTIPCQRRSGQ